VGVLGRIRVRSGWIDIKDVTPTKVSEKLRRNWSQLWGNDAVSKHRRDMFERLLAHLVALALQSPNDNKSATLAASAMVFSPIDLSFQGRNAEQERQAIKVDPTIVESFLQSPFGKEDEVLRQLGVTLSDDDDSMREQISKALYGFVETQLLYYSDVWAQRALARSLGFSIETIRRVSETGSGLTQTFVTLKIGGAMKELSTREILRPDGDGSHYGDARALVRGKTAFDIAKALGFKKSYQSLQRKISPYAVKTQGGNLISIRELALAIEAMDVLQCLVGSEMTFEEVQPHF
jgi:hypothetical protein